MAKITFTYDVERLRRREEAIKQEEIGEPGRNVTARRLFERAYGRRPTGLLEGCIDDMSFEECFGYTPGDQ